MSETVSFTLGVAGASSPAPFGLSEGFLEVDFGAAAPFAQADFLVVEAFKAVLAHGCLSVPAAVGIGAYHDKTLGSPRGL